MAIFIIDLLEEININHIYKKGMPAAVMRALILQLTGNSPAVEQSGQVIRIYIMCLHFQKKHEACQH